MAEHVGSGIDWKDAGKFALAHWPEVAIGFVAIVGFFYFAGGSSSSTATTPTTTTTTTAPSSGYSAGMSAAAYQAQAITNQAQLAFDTAQVNAAAQTTVATIQANAQTNQTTINANSSAYIAGTTAQAEVANYADAALSAQTTQALNSLSQGFIGVVTSAAQQTSADASAAAGVAANNDNTAGNTLGRTLAAASGLGSLAAPAISSMFGGSQVANSGGSSLLNSSSAQGQLNANNAVTAAIGAAAFV